MDKNIFVISWFYPPINSSEGIVTFKLLKNSNFSYVVFTQDKDTSWSYDEKEENLKSPNITVIKPNKKVTLKEFITEAYSYFLEHANEFDVIMTRSMPPETHAVGLLIKKQYPHIMWIASFGDPIANHPYEKLRHLTTNIKIKFLNRNYLGYLKSLFIKKIKNLITNGQSSDTIEFKTIELADCLIFNNEYQKSYMLEGKMDLLKKSIVIPHSYDPDLFKNLPIQNKMVYLGHLDDIRTPKYFFSALAKLVKNYSIPEDFKIQFYGKFNFSKKMLKDLGIEKYVETKGEVNYLKSLEIIKSSKWLLSIDAKLNQVIDDNIFLPSKLIDYLGSGNNVFCITMLSGISSDIVHEYGGLVSSHIVSDIYNNLKYILVDQYECTINKEFVLKYRSKNIAKEFDTKILKIIDKRI